MGALEPPHPARPPRPLLRAARVGPERQREAQIQRHAVPEKKMNSHWQSPFKEVGLARAGEWGWGRFRLREQLGQRSAGREFQEHLRGSRSGSIPGGQVPGGGEVGGGRGRIKTPSSLNPHSTPSISPQPFPGSQDGAGGRARWQTPVPCCFFWQAFE